MRRTRFWPLFSGTSEETMTCAAAQSTIPAAQSTHQPAGPELGGRSAEATDPLPDHKAHIHGSGTDSHKQLRGRCRRSPCVGTYTADFSSAPVRRP